MIRHTGARTAFAACHEARRGARTRFRCRIAQFLADVAGILHVIRREDDACCERLQQDFAAILAVDLVQLRGRLDHRQWAYVIARDEGNRIQHDRDAPHGREFVQDHEQLVFQFGVDLRELCGLFPNRLLKKHIHHDLQTLKISWFDA